MRSQRHGGKWEREREEERGGRKREKKGRELRSKMEGRIVGVGARACREFFY